MILNIIVVLLILGIAFYQAIQGLFSAVIMAILTILAAVIAFNYYDSVGGFFAGRLYEYAHPASLLALFVLPLLVVRELFDRFLGGNVLLGVWADRIGGGAMGLLVALVIVGMLCITIQLLPMKAAIFDYEPYDSTLMKKAGGPIRLAGSFTLGLAGRLSNGPLSPIFGGARFDKRHDDLLLEAYCARNRPTGGRAGAKPDALEVDRAFVLPPDQPDTAALLDAVPAYRQPLLGVEESKVMVVRVRVNQSVRSTRKGDTWFRLPATHFRLVTESGRGFYPVGYLTYAGIWRLNTAETEARIAKVGEILVARPGGPAKLTVDWVYRLPGAEKPDYLVFRRTAMAPVLAAAEGTPPPRGALVPSPVKYSGKFLAAQRAWLLRPTAVTLSVDLPDKIPLKIVPDNLLPKAIQSWTHQEGKLKTARIVGGWKGLSGRGKGNYVRDFYVTGEKVTMAQVTCDVRGSSRDLAALRGIRPVLLLENGQRCLHQGAMFLYTKDQMRYTYWYYDTVRPDAPFDAMFGQAMVDNASAADSVTIYLRIPAERTMKVVALVFEDAADPRRSRVFPLERPLTCVARP